MKAHVDLSSIPIGVLVIIGILAVAEVALDVYALVDLVRRPRQRVAFGNKWIWVAIIVLVNLIGGILYLAIGRRAAPPTEQRSPAAGGAGSTTSVADALYGKSGERGELREPGERENR